ncbi:hypothetical protein HK102_013550 [Quaeritorhiza haematococci]|nr:hypothetical protein HK102_013550 [Quaeritorhiza haematococci]
MSTQYRKLATELAKSVASNIDKARDLKDEGNSLYKSGKYKQALTKYIKAIEIDATNAAALSNACQTLIVLDRLEEAAEMAERCVRVKPTWGKAWYRKGTVAMKRRLYADAMSAFQQGLSCEPDDPDLKRCYKEASRLAEKTPKEGGGFDHRMMGMMMELRHKSMNVRSWHTANSHKIKLWPPNCFGTSKGKSNFTLDGPGLTEEAFSAWWNKYVWKGVAEKKGGGVGGEGERRLSSECARYVERAVKAKYKGFRSGMSVADATEWVFEGGLHKGSSTPNSPRSFILPQSPLITLAIWLKFLRTSEPDGIDDWCVAWTFQASASAASSSPSSSSSDGEDETADGRRKRKNKWNDGAVRSPLFPYICSGGGSGSSGHGLYGVILSKEENVVVDVLGCWAKMVEEDMERRGGNASSSSSDTTTSMWGYEDWMGLRKSGKDSGEEREKLDRDMPIYTCDEELAFMEFLEAYCEGEGVEDGKEGEGVGPDARSVGAVENITAMKGQTRSAGDAENVTATNSDDEDDEESEEDSEDESEQSGSSSSESGEEEREEDLSGPKSEPPVTGKTKTGEEKKVEGGQTKSPGTAAKTNTATTRFGSLMEGVVAMFGVLLALGFYLYLSGALPRELQKWVAGIWR